MRDAILRSIVDWPRHLRRFLSWDEEAEMARHAELTVAADLSAYFCDPQSRWQRATNENTHGLLRLEAVAAPLNGRPRKTSGWKSPTEALDAALENVEIDHVATAA